MRAELDLVREMRRFNCQIRIRRTRELAVRLWLGKKLFLLAAWVMNCNLEVDEEVLE
jgi:hypothetical protein